MVDIVRIITFGVGIAFLINGYWLVRRGRESIALFLMSGGVGLGLMVVALVPDIFDIVAAVLGLELKGRAILVVANLTLFVLVTYLFNLVGELHSDLSRLNEELSLLRNELEDASDD